MLGCECLFAAAATWSRICCFCLHRCLLLLPLLAVVYPALPNPHHHPAPVSAVCCARCCACRYVHRLQQRQLLLLVYAASGALRWERHHQTSLTQ
jgi:hypothetical protein